jgi:hypothetical protein
MGVAVARHSLCVFCLIKSGYGVWLRSSSAILIQEMVISGYPCAANRGCAVNQHDAPTRCCELILDNIENKQTFNQTGIFLNFK